MEARKIKFCSCRLAPQQHSGRVRWCFGHETEWQMKLKALVFLPIVLLIFVVLILFLTKYPANIRKDSNAPLISIKQYDEDEMLENEERRDILKDIRTSFVTDTINKTYAITRKKRHTPEDEINIIWKNRLNSNKIRNLQSKIIKKYMNQSVDPCDNFYEFACGNWKNYHSIPADRASYDTFEILRENLDVVLGNLLMENNDVDKSTSTQHISFKKSYIDKTNNNRNFTTDATIKAKQYFQSCMNEEKLKERDIKPLRKLLDDFGGWPMISRNWNETNFNLEWLMAELRLFNNDILIAQWIGPDMIDSNRYIIQIDQTTLGLPGRTYFLDPSYKKYVEAYREFIFSITMLLGASDIAEASKNVNDLIEFEINLANIMTPNENRHNISDLYVRTTIRILTSRFPDFDWIQYFSAVLGKNLDIDDPIACYCIDYLQKLFILLNKTSRRTVTNYLLWRFVKHRTNNLDKKFLEAKQRFYRVLFGREQSPTRWQFCVSQVNANMGMAVGNLFIKNFYDETSKNDTLEMTLQIQEAFREILEANDWLGDQTKDYALMKIDKMNLKIGYPDSILDKTKLTEQYYDVEIHPDYFFENTLSILRHLSRVEQKKLDMVVDKNLWNTAPAVVNAYYSRNKNQIIFPAGILQPPFYHKYFPKSLNFGGIGVVIGHEITHGFDDKGRLFDQHGNLQQWWKEEAIEKFHEKTKCLIEQYNSYIIPTVETKIDGFITQGENIADNGGLKQAFKAYQNWLKTHPDENETLPDVDLTAEQLFFLNFAQVWCGEQRFDALKSRLKVAVHSPGLFRVIGSLSNSEDFSKTFNCPVNSKMNPLNKCILW